MKNTYDDYVEYFYTILDADDYIDALHECAESEAIRKLIVIAKTPEEFEALGRKIKSKCHEFYDDEAGEYAIKKLGEDKMG